MSCFYSMTQLPPRSTLFPYTTLFRSSTASGRLATAARFLPARTAPRGSRRPPARRSEEHTSELQSRENLVCRLLLEKKKIADEVLESSNYSKIQHYYSNKLNARVGCI